MDKRTTKTSKVAAWILWIVNFFVMMVCIFTTAFGLWIISSPASLSAVIDATGSPTIKALFQEMLTLQVGIAVTAISIFLFFVCFMGFYGAITRSPFLLFMYSTLVLLLMLLECALLFYFSSNLVEKGLQDDGQWTHAMRLAFKCCEHNTSIPETKKPPWSCCGPDAYPDNCTTLQMFKKVLSQPASCPPSSTSVVRQVSPHVGSQTLNIIPRPSTVKQSLLHMNQYYTPDTSYLLN